MLALPSASYSSLSSSFLTVFIIGLLSLSEKMSSYTILSFYISILGTILEGIQEIK
jgi:hypothetical protein